MTTPCIVSNSRGMVYFNNQISGPDFTRIFKRIDTHQFLRCVHSYLRKQNLNSDEILFHESVKIEFILQISHSEWNDTTINTPSLLNKYQIPRIRRVFG